MSDQIPLGLIGISHKTAPVEVREKVALSEEEQKQFTKGKRHLAAQDFLFAPMYSTHSNDEMKGYPAEFVERINVSLNELVEGLDRNAHFQSLFMSKSIELWRWARKRVASNI